MYGDFSRLTFNRANFYTAAWSQQGRMQLDADFNEQTAILLDWMRTLATDFLGPAGGNTETAGFDVTIDGSGELSLNAGHYYVAGIRCEIPAPGPDGNPALPTYSPDTLGIPSTGTYLVCLTVWERSVSGLQDPTLLEPALGPTTPDTTIRTQVVWAPVVLPGQQFWTDNTKTPIDYDGVDKLFVNMNNPPSRPTLKATTIQGYSGLENQLYRIEIHQGNADTPKANPTFKWSRDNGSVEFGIDQTAQAQEKDSKVIHLVGAGLLPGRPKLEALDCVEVIDTSWVPFGAPGPLYSVVTGVDPIENTVTLDQAVDTPGTPVLLRRWDSAPIPGDVPTDGSPVTIDNGIEVVFDAPSGATYARGDFWLIPARAATGRIYGPTTDETGAPPYGPQRHYAPLALVNPGAGGANNGVYDLRSLFTRLAWPLAEQQLEWKP